PREPVDVSPVELPDPVPLGRVVIIIVVGLVSLGVAGSITGSWETILLWLHRVPYDPSGAIVPDPVFGRDISFFLFDLPFLRLVQTEANALLVAAIVVAGARYLLSAMAGAAVFDTRVRVHLGVLAGLFLLTIALGYQLDKLDLVHGSRGVATGVSYTDQNAQFVAYDIPTFVSAIAAALLVGGAFARLWDYRPLGDTLDQLQTVLQYYDFVDVDTDRYMLNGELRQVMLSARELALDKNPSATGWVNQRLVYTHGMGAAMVPVSAVGSQGQPQLVISNMPPVSTGGAPQITEPRIYFGERDSSYVIVGA